MPWFRNASAPAVGVSYIRQMSQRAANSAMVTVAFSVKLAASRPSSLASRWINP